jgi:hypothetical protein
MNLPTVEEGMLAMQRIDTAVACNDWDSALELVQAHAREIRGRSLVSLPELREMIDRYQGLIAHVESLRQETRAELLRLSGGRDAARYYADA